MRRVVRLACIFRRKPRLISEVAGGSERAITRDREVFSEFYRALCSAALSQCRSCQ